MFLYVCVLCVCGGGVGGEEYFSGFILPSFVKQEVDVNAKMTSQSNITMHIDKKIEEITLVFSLISHKHTHTRTHTHTHTHTLLSS